MVVLLFACLSSQAKHPHLAACMPAQSPSRHSRQQAQNESSESSSLMSIPPEHRLYRHVGPDGIPYMPWLWRMTCLTFKNSWRRLSAILDYVNSMLPHMNSNDHIGSLRQCNCMCILKNCIFFYKNKYNMICTVRPFAGGHLEYLKFLKDTMVSPICRRPS